MRADRAARAVAAVRRPARRHQPRPAGQSDARHPDGGRPRLLLHPRRARAPGESARRVRRSGRAATRRTSSSSTSSRIRSTASRRAVAPLRRASRRASLPLMRARVVGVDGRRAQLPNADAVRREGSSTREFGLTYPRRAAGQRAADRGHVLDRAATTATPPDGVDTEVSIEQEVHDEAQVDVGDVMRFDIAGRSARARHQHPRGRRGTRRRTADSSSCCGPAPAVERDAAHVRRVSSQVRDDPAARGALQRDAGRSAIPNVSAIDVRDVLASIREVVDNVTLGVTVVGAVTLVGGMLILDRRRGDDEVPAAVRGGDLPHARRQHAACWPPWWPIEYGVLGPAGRAPRRRGRTGPLLGRCARYLFEIEWRPAPGSCSLAGVVAHGRRWSSVVGLVGERRRPRAQAARGTLKRASRRHDGGAQTDRANELDIDG